MARKPQKSHGKPFRTAIAQPQEPQQPQGASIPTCAAPADEIEERVALAADRVPTFYLDAWGRLQCQRPMRVSDEQWRQAIDGANRFLDQWGSLALEFQWTPGDLFDIPGDGKPAVRVKNAQTEFSCGLAWFLKGERVRGLGPEHAVLGDGTRAFDRVTRREWVSSYIGRDKCKNHCIAKTGGDVA